VADLWFHSMLAWRTSGSSPADVLAELRRREGPLGPRGIRGPQGTIPRRGGEEAMNDVVDATPNPAPDAAKLESLKQLTMIIYILQAASFVVGTPASSPW
jgi:hypothetical protein